MNKKNEYINNYNAKNYNNVTFRVKKEDSEILIEIAKSNGYSTLAAYAKALFEKAITENNISNNNNASGYNK